MRFAIFIFFIFLLISCQSEPATPVVKPVDFDKNEYAQNLAKGRDSLRNTTPVITKKKPKTKPNQQPVAIEEPVKKPTIPKVEPEPVADTIQLKITYGKAKSDTSKLARQKVFFKLNSDTANFLNLKVTLADSLANLRITQIISPSGISDGPFGSEIKYQITEKGDYKVLVSESLMNGEPYSGKFSFEVKLGW